MGRARIEEDQKEEEEEEEEPEEDKGEEQHLLKSNQQDPVRETEARKPNQPITRQALLQLRASSSMNRLSI